MKDAIVATFFGKTEEELPIMTKTSNNIANVFLGFEKRLKDPDAILFQHAKLLPWIKIKALRTSNVECTNYDLAVDLGESCWSTLFDKDNFLTEDFDGSPFVEGQLFDSLAC